MMYVKIRRTNKQTNILTDRQTDRQTYFFQGVQNRGRTRRKTSYISHKLYYIESSLWQDVRNAEQEKNC